MKYPKIYLAIDNCFAFKRWTKPDEWAKVIKGLGVNYIEASSDNELDPYYMGEDYLKDWVEEVIKAEKDYDVKVVNLYSGQGSYTTLGLAHTDIRVSERMKENWFKKLIDIAAELDAGLGFFAHAFSDETLQDKYEYEKCSKMLIENFAELAAYSKSKECKKIGVEQMYSPHQVPWRINEAKNLLKDIKKTGSDFYITENIGHHLIKFVKPTKKMIEEALDNFDSIGKITGLWLGTKKAYELLEEAIKYRFKSDEIIKKIAIEMNSNPQMFSEKRDGDCYEWIKELGCYSPIIHLQQTTGTISAHWHFTEENNKVGIITPKKILKALKESYDKRKENGMPKKCDKIYLTIEAFTSTASINVDMLADYKTSVNYWRRHIPRDGMHLSDLI